MPRDGLLCADPGLALCDHIPDFRADRDHRRRRHADPLCGGHHAMVRPAARSRARHRHRRGRARRRAGAAIGGGIDCRLRLAYRLSRARHRDPRHRLCAGRGLPARAAGSPARRGWCPRDPAAGHRAGRGVPFGLFWGLAVAFFLDVIAINGTLTHIVALMTDRGIALQAATATLSGVGIALILGRILSGWCLDRMWGPYVAVAFFVLPMLGIALLASGATGIVPFAGAVTLGLGIGAEVDLMAFFTSRYFGARHYAKIYGTIFGIFAFGVGVGPALSGASFDLFHSYPPVFMIYEVMLAISCAIFLRLGPYPYPAREPVRSEAAVKVPASDPGETSWT